MSFGSGRPGTAPPGGPHSVGRRPSGTVSPFYAMQVQRLTLAPATGFKQWMRRSELGFRPVWSARARLRVAPALGSKLQDDPFALPLDGRWRREGQQTRARVPAATGYVKSMCLPNGEHAAKSKLTERTRQSGRGPRNCRETTSKRGLKHRWPRPARSRYTVSKSPPARPAREEGRTFDGLGLTAGQNTLACLPR